MDIDGEYRLPLPRQRVWQALNDPAILKAAIPGCESLEKISNTHMRAHVVAKIGPVKAKFKGEVTLSELKEPESYVIAGEGTGGAVGFAKGSAKVVLTEDGGETILTYTAKAEVGGKLAQIGSRLVVAASKKLADDFFKNFAQELTGPKSDKTIDTRQASKPPAISDKRARNIIISAVILALLVGLYYWLK